MRATKSKLRPVGIYIAIAILIYALVGALTNDIYLPGRRTDGVHLHHEAISPALFGMALFALTFFLGDLKKSRSILFVRRALFVGSAFSMALCFYFIAKPSGKTVATTQECQETFAKLEAFAGSSAASGDGTDFFRELGMQCASAPILKSFHSCVERAKKPADVNGCSEESRMLFERKNATWQYIQAELSLQFGVVQAFLVPVGE